MIQTVGHEILPGLSFCLEIPLVRRQTKGLAKYSNLDYPHRDNQQYKLDLSISKNCNKEETDNEDNDDDCNDEVEDLYQLLLECKIRFPTVNAVCSGAILSNYQRLRVEAICKRLDLHPLAPLWGLSQRWLVRQMCALDSYKVDIKDDVKKEDQPAIDAVIVKVAALGLTRDMIGKSIFSLRPRLEELARTSGVGECGEGGEYETIALNCNKVLFPNFKLVIDKMEIISSGSGSFYSKIHMWHIERKLMLEKNSISDDTFSNLSSTIPIPSHSELRDCVIWSTKTHNSPHDLLLMSSESYKDKHKELYTLTNERGKNDNLSFSSSSMRSSNIFTISVSSSTCSLSLHQPINAAFECLEKAKHILLNHGLTLNDVCNCHVYLQNMDDFESVNIAFKQFFTMNQFPPSRSAIEVKQKQSKSIKTVSPLIKIDFTALRGGSTACINGIRSIRSTLFVASRSGWAPECIGPYCQANLLLNKIVLAAGQIGLDPSTMTLITYKNIVRDWENDQKGNETLKYDIKLESVAQCIQALRNISRVLASCSSSLPQSLFILVYIPIHTLEANEEVNDTSMPCTFLTSESILNVVESWASGRLQRERKDEVNQYEDDNDDNDETFNTDAEPMLMEKTFGLRHIVSVEESQVDKYPLLSSAYEPPSYHYDSSTTSKIVSKKEISFISPPVVLIHVSKLPRNALIEIEAISVTDSDKISRHVLSVPVLETLSQIVRTDCVLYLVSDVTSAMTITVADTLSEIKNTSPISLIIDNVNVQLATSLALALTACFQYSGSGVTRLLRLFLARSCMTEGITNEFKEEESFVDLLFNFIIKELVKDDILSIEEARTYLPAVTLSEVDSVQISNECAIESSSIKVYTRGVTAVLTEFK
jgi:uncharacterized protein (TIGR00290 family)